MGRRLPNGRKPVDSCVIVLLVGASLLAGLGYFPDRGREVGPVKAVAGSDIKPGMWVQLTPGDDAFRVSQVGPLANAETWLKVFNEDGFPCAVRRDAWYAEVEF